MKGTFRSVRSAEHDDNHDRKCSSGSFHADPRTATRENECIQRYAVWRIADKAVDNTHTRATRMPYSIIIIIVSNLFLISTRF
jgi:hypothetical protein